MKKLGLAHKMMLVVCLPLLALLFSPPVRLRTLSGRTGDERRPGRAGGGEGGGAAGP